MTKELILSAAMMLVLPATGAMAISVDPTDGPHQESSEVRASEKSKRELLDDSVVAVPVFDRIERTETRSDVEVGALSAATGIGLNDTNPPAPTSFGEELEEVAAEDAALTSLTVAQANANNLVATPVPAGGGLLLAALVGLGVLRRQRLTK